MINFPSFETAKSYTKKYTVDNNDEFVVKQEDGQLGYLSVSDVAAHIGGEAAAIPAGTISSSAQITNLGFISSSEAAQIPVGTISGSQQITDLGFSSQTIDTSTLATTGSNIFNGNQTISGSLIVTDSIQGTGSLFLQPDLNDSRALRIYNTAPSDIHIKANSVLSYFGDDTNYLLIDDSNGDVTLRANSDITLHANNGDIILNSDGSVYVGSVSSGNAVITDGYLAGVIGDTNVVNNSTGHTITDNLTNITNQLPTFATTGSNQFVGNQYFIGSLIPQGSGSYSLGSLENPWKDVFLSSGSLVIASDTPGAAPTIMTNIDGNLQISVGGMQLLGSASFNATTASFSYLTGSTKFDGDMQLTGSFSVSGSTTQIGNNTLLGNTILSGSISVSGSVYFTALHGKSIEQFSESLDSRILAATNEQDLSRYTTTSSFNAYTQSNDVLHSTIGTLTGSFATTGSNVFIGIETISGSLLVSGSTTHNGDINVLGNETISGNLTVTGSLVMGGTKQEYISIPSVVNPTNHIIHQYLTSSYYGASYVLSAVEISTGKAVTTHMISSQGNTKVGHLQTYQVESEGTSPSIVYDSVISGSYITLTATLNNKTLSFRGIVQIF